MQLGTANILILRTGKFTEIGLLSTELAALSTGEIPLQAKVNVLGKLLGAVVNVLELVAGKKCTPVYDGKLVHPVKKKK